MLLFAQNQERLLHYWQVTEQLQRPCTVQC